MMAQREPKRAQGLPKVFQRQLQGMPKAIQWRPRDSQRGPWRPKGSSNGGPVSLHHSSRSTAPALAMLALKVLRKGLRTVSTPGNHLPENVFSVIVEGEQASREIGCRHILGQFHGRIAWLQGTGLPLVKKSCNQLYFMFLYPSNPIWIVLSCKLPCMLF
jgi:hypothetical protein